MKKCGLYLPKKVTNKIEHEKHEYQIIVSRNILRHADLHSDDTYMKDCEAEGRCANHIEVCLHPSLEVQRAASRVDLLLSHDSQLETKWPHQINSNNDS